MAPKAATTSRPGNFTICATFAALSALGLWAMRISTAREDVPVGFLDIIKTGIMPNGLQLKKHYTGVGPLDEMLSFLVAAFLAGPTRWNESFYWLQLHFLLQITPYIAIMTVEACRERNQGSWLIFTTAWAFLYQNVGGAVIISIWWLIFHRDSSANIYFVRGGAVQHAGLIGPSLFILFLLPTLAMFIPNLSIDTLQSLIAFWQLSPLYVNVPLWFASAFGSKSSDKERDIAGANLSQLKLLYGLNFLLCATIHAYTIYGIATTTNPSVGFASVFVPSMYKWKNSYADGLIWIFQWDWIIIALGSTIACITTVCDIQRIRYGKVSFEQFCEAMIATIGLTWLAGPGAALSAIWYWREQKMDSFRIKRVE